MQPPIQPRSPRVSVIVNVYNGERDVIEALDAISAQSFDDFEVLVWDDGSTDRTPALVAHFVRSDPRFTLLTSSTNQGLVAGRTRVIEQTRANWIAICDADDIWLPDKLQAQMAAVDAYEPCEADGLPLVVIGASGCHINADGQIRGFFDVGNHDLVDYDESRADGDVFYVLNSSAVFRKDVYEEVGGFREDYFPGEDVDLWTRMAERGVILNLREVLVHYRVHGDSISDRGMIRQMINAQRVEANAKRRNLGMDELSDEEFLGVLRSHPDMYRRKLRAWNAQKLYRRAGGSLANGRYLEGIAFMARAFVMDAWVPLERAQRQVFRRETVAQWWRP